MNKKVIFIISLLTFMSMFNVSFAFTDTTNHWASDTINKFENYKIVTGYDDNTFKPDDCMTRAEFITVINKILGSEDESAKYIPDISRDDWYYHEIRKAVKLGIVQGDEQGYIYPNAPITREEAVVILGRAFKIKNAYTIKTSSTDAYAISKWARGEFYAAVNYGYISGYEDQTLRPQGTITRAEVITIISRIIPNILTIDVYSGDIHGNTLVYSDNVVLTNATVTGSLFISDSAIGTLKAKNVIVERDLVVGNENHSALIEGLAREERVYLVGDEISTAQKLSYIWPGHCFTVPYGTEEVTLRSAETTWEERTNSLVQKISAPKRVELPQPPEGYALTVTPQPGALTAALQVPEGSDPLQEYQIGVYSVGSMTVYRAKGGESFRLYGSLVEPRRVRIGVTDDLWSEYLVDLPLEKTFVQKEGAFVYPHEVELMVMRNWGAETEEEEYLFLFTGLDFEKYSFSFYYTQNHKKELTGPAVLCSADWTGRRLYLKATELLEEEDRYVLQTSGVMAFEVPEMKTQTPLVSVAVVGEAQVTMDNRCQTDGEAHPQPVKKQVDAKDSVAEFLFTPNETGLYDMTIAREGCLTCTIRKIPVMDEDVFLGTVELLRGDMTGDEKINMQDLRVFLQNFNKTGENIGESLTDVNEDGKVNMQDLRIFLKNFNKTAEKDCTVVFGM